MELGLVRDIRDKSIYNNAMYGSKPYNCSPANQLSVLY